MRKLLLAAILAAFAGSVVVAAPVAFAADDSQLAQAPAKKDDKMKKDKAKDKPKPKKKDDKKKDDKKKS